jgi:hypothetical protein
MVAQTCYLSYLGGRDWEDWVQGQPGKNFKRPHLNTHTHTHTHTQNKKQNKSKKQELNMVVHLCHSSYEERVNSRIMIESSQGINARPISKITKAKGGGAIAQVVEPLSSKLSVLSSNLVLKIKSYVETNVEGSLYMVVQFLPPIKLKYNTKMKLNNHSKLPSSQVGEQGLGPKPLLSNPSGTTWPRCLKKIYHLTLVIR